MAKKAKPQIKLSWIVLGVVAIVVIWSISIYNGLISMQEGANTAWANIETQYQRRADLVPQLVATVQGAADFEGETLRDVTEARTQWLNSGDGSRSDQIQAANAFDSALSRLLVTVESYPVLRSTENFQTLQSQLEGTENRIAVARRDYNEIVRPYNTQIRRFPASAIAGVFNFDRIDQFESAEGSEDAPEVDFDFSDSSE